MNFEQSIITSLELISAWNIADEEFADAMIDHAMLMAGVNPDDIPQRFPDTH